MNAAIQVPVLHPRSLFVGGEWVSPIQRGFVDVVNSGTEEVFARVAAAGREDVDAVVVAARRAFDHGPWPQMAPEERAVYLTKIATELSARAPDIADCWTIESGIVRSLAGPTVEAVAGIFAWYADLARSFPFVEQRYAQPGQLGILALEPVGVAACIVPWNGPIVTAVMKCAPALLAGCTVILKAAPEAPATLYILAEVCQKIGLPPGVLNLITADRDVSEQLVRHPGVDKVSFTGSTSAGRRVAAICGERIARVTLELGGKSPALVMDDCEIERAARVLCAQAIPVTGQVCSSLTRVIVSRHRHDALVEAMSSNLRAVSIGDPFDPATNMGPLAMSRQRDRVESLVSSGVAEGAILATGGHRPTGLPRGFYFEPTVFGHVRPEHRIAREEIFGPVLSVMIARDEEEAIGIANDTMYGLNATVFTSDADKAYAVARRLRSGTVGHNEFRSDFVLGMGGFKQSGIGREGGVAGLRGFLEPKAIILDECPAALAPSTVQV